MTLEDKFKGLALDEPIKIEIEDEELELDIRVEDIVPLMSMGTNQGDIGQEDVEMLTDTFRTILYRTYLPYWDDVRGQEPDNLADSAVEENEKVKKHINGLLVRKLPVLINKIVEELGWAEEGAAGQDFPTQAENLQQ